MRRTLVKIIAIAIMLALVLSLTNIVTASYADKMSSLIGEADTFVVTSGATDSANKIIGTVISAARIIGVCFAVVMLLAIAMKYMTAAAGDKADIKKSAVAYVVGAIVLFAVTGILTIIEKFSVAISA